MPQMFTGTLTGAVTVLPDPSERLPLPVTFPFPPVLPAGGLTRFVTALAPPTQPELAKPRIAAEIPHRLIGTLTGAGIVLPDPSEGLLFPVTLPLPGPAA